MQHESMVYRFHAQGTARVKIGVTTDLEARRRSVQTGCPWPVVVLATWPGDERLETAIHKEFAEYRRAGEWFELPPLYERRLHQVVALSSKGDVKRRAVQDQGDFVRLFRYELHYSRRSTGYAVLVKKRLRWSAVKYSKVIYSANCHGLTDAMVRKLRSGRMTPAISSVLDQAGVGGRIIMSVLGMRQGKGTGLRYRDLSPKQKSKVDFAVRVFSQAH